MFEKTLDDLSAEDFGALVETRIPEGRQLEFKRDHYGRTDEARREFAADVSAFANAQGGYLFVGIAEENGVASAIPGVEAPDPDALVRAVVESLRTSIEPPIPGLRVRWIEIATGRGVLAIQVDRSWNAPHRVTVAKDNRFFLRDENGKHPMSVTELRRAFLFASEVEERIRHFRQDRLELLTANEGPLAIRQDGPAIVLHLVPQASFTENVQLAFEDQRPGLFPMGSGGGNRMHSLDGLVSYSGHEERFETVRAFTTLFRNAIVEAVASVGTIRNGERSTINLKGMEFDTMPAVSRALKELTHYAVPPPYYLMISLTGVRGLCAPADDWGTTLAYPHLSDRILLPELLIDDVGDRNPPHTLLRPLFDLLWNAFGQAGSPSYDRDGNYLR
nr:ATP-binding protein [Sphingomonas colocasiae]